jgi:predicted NUDIX family NTP pyrophosphohydrolase
LKPVKREDAWKMKRSRISSGLLVFRTRNDELEVLLVHPGGPFFQYRDDGIWSVPKGEAAKGEDLKQRARIEFEEEVGVRPPLKNWIKLGTIIQKGGKTVHAWAAEGDLPGDFKLKSNTFELEWPPRSGRMQAFPEVDRAFFFSIEIARQKIKSTQEPFLDRLIDSIRSRKPEQN